MAVTYLEDRHGYVAMAMSYSSPPLFPLPFLPLILVSNCKSVNHLPRVVRPRTRFVARCTITTIFRANRSLIKSQRSARPGHYKLFAVNTPLVTSVY